jgi:uncharacterized phiE125 gp8 family phage protein
VKTWLKIDEDNTADDTLLTQLIATARERYEAYTQRVPLHGTYDAVLDDFPAGCPLSLSRVPLVSITSVTGYTDTDVTDTGGTAMSSTGYYVDTASQPGRLVPLGGATYPTATRVANAAIVRFVAGYSSDSTGVPDDVLTDLYTMVARAYEHRGDEAAMEHAMLAVLAPESLVVHDWG